MTQPKVLYHEALVALSQDKRVCLETDTEGFYFVLHTQLPPTSAMIENPAVPESVKAFWKEAEYSEIEFHPVICYAYANHVIAGEFPMPELSVYNQTYYVILD